MKEMFDWVPWFNELAKKIADGGQQYLNDRSREVNWHGASPFANADAIDPLLFITVVANEGGKIESRDGVFASLAEIFEIPPLQTGASRDVWHFPLSLRLFQYDNPDEPANRDVVWRLLRVAVSRSLDAETFEAVAHLPGIGWSRLTSALVLIDAYAHLRLSETAESYTEAYGVSPVGQKPLLADYQARIAKTRSNFPGCQLYEIEMFARLQGAEKEGGQDLVVSPDRCWIATTNVSWGTQVGRDHWSEFDENHWVRVEHSSGYPVERPERGDLVLARHGPRNGRGIGIVYRNDYDDEREEEGRIHTLWLNKSPCEFERPLRPPAFAEALESHAAAFRQSAEYSPTWALLDRVTYLREVRAALEDDGYELGKVWRLLKSRKRIQEIRRHIGNAHTIRQIHALLLQDRVPEAPTIRAAAYRSVSRFARENEARFSKQTKAKLSELASKCNDSSSADSPDVGLEEVILPQDRRNPVVQHDRNQILYGPPGTGKTYETVSHALAIVDGVEVETVRGERRENPESTRQRYAELRFKRPDSLGGTARGRIAMVTFHQNYAYEDFVEGIRPKLASTEGDDVAPGSVEPDSTELAYELRHGIFRSICQVAAEARRDAEAGGRQTPRYVLVIDEINRGNIPKIFGELITLIEPSRRLGAGDETTVTLPYSGHDFGVPDNLYIIGTMNTADRSIQQLDTALRRRFTFVEMMPKAKHDLISENVDGVNCQTMLRAMNERIALLLDREHRIGHTYLLKVDTMEQLADTFRNRIFPLLQEYFYDDWRKIRAVLGNNAFVEERKLTDAHMKTLAERFGRAEDDCIYERLSLSSDEWQNSEQYKKIYVGPKEN